MARNISREAALRGSRAGVRAFQEMLATDPEFRAQFVESSKKGRKTFLRKYNKDPSFRERHREASAQGATRAYARIMAEKEKAAKSGEQVRDAVGAASDPGSDARSCEGRALTHAGASD